MLKSFCENNGLEPAVMHKNSKVDYTYSVNMCRFNILDHFLVSGVIFDNGIDNLCSLHDVDNLSDHDVLLLSLSLKVECVKVAAVRHKVAVSWL